MLLGNNNNTNTIPTQADHNIQPSQQPIVSNITTKNKVVPTTLKTLLTLIIIQLLFQSATIAVQIIFQMIGYTNTTLLVIDKPNCTQYLKLQQYQSKQQYVMKITFTAICLSILLTIIILLIIIKLLHSSTRLPQTYYPQNQTQQSTQLSLTISSLYIIIRPKKRILLYMLQSINILSLLLVFGYYLVYYLQFTINSCQWNDNQNIMLHIMVIGGLAGIAFIVGWVVWVIIVVINMKNRWEDQYQVNQQQANKQQYKNINNTITQADQTKKQLLKTQQNNNNKQNVANDKKIAYPYYNPTTHKYQQSDPNPKPNPQPQIQRVNTLNTSKQNSPNSKNIPHKQQNIFDPEPDNNNHNHNKYTSPSRYRYNQQYQNPVFRKQKQLYESPYQRINNGKYYQGDPLDYPNKNIQRQRQIQGKKSRFNTYQNQYNMKDYGADDNYGASLQKYRQQLQDKNILRTHQQQRRILPQNSNSNNKNGYKNYEGSRPKLHNTYFKDQTGMFNKRKNQNSDEKKKKKGILNDYIHEKYVDG